MFTKKHFDAIAATFRDMIQDAVERRDFMLASMDGENVRDPLGSGGYRWMEGRASGIMAAIGRQAQLFENINPKFDRARFYEACGVCELMDFVLLPMHHEAEKYRKPGEFKRPPCVPSDSQVGIYLFDEID